MKEGKDVDALVEAIDELHDKHDMIKEFFAPRKAKLTSDVELPHESMLFAKLLKLPHLREMIVDHLHFETSLKKQQFTKGSGTISTSLFIRVSNTNLFQRSLHSGLSTIRPTSALYFNDIKTSLLKLCTLVLMDQCKPALIDSNNNLRHTYTLVDSEVVENILAPSKDLKTTRSCI